jgi:GTPase SAR1 family protein
MGRLAIVFVGPAGSGKTLLTRALGNWLEGSGYSVDYINMDPAAEVVPYTPTFDVRSIVRTEDIMVREGLGPNGAIVRAIDILAENSGRVLDELSRLRGDVVLVDTPGQMEVLLFRPSGAKLVDVVRRVARPVGVFLVDPTLGLRGAEAAVAVLMAIVAQLRLEIPVVPVVSKADAVGIRGGLFSANVDSEVEELLDHLGRAGAGLLPEMLAEVLQVVRKYLRAERLIAVSAVTGEGIEELYKLVHEVFCSCGDLT